jgi:phage terminase large subunit-like protein
MSWASLSRSWITSATSYVLPLPSMRMAGCWDTILYSCVKKSGKTTLNGALTLWWAATQEAPDEILILANDLEQSLARVFKTMEGIVQHNPELQREAKVQTKTIT